jgi:hypothetical protein
MQEGNWCSSVGYTLPLTFISVNNDREMLSIFLLEASFWIVEEAFLTINLTESVRVIPCFLERNYLCSHNLLFFFHGPKACSVPGPPHFRGFKLKLRHITFCRTPLVERSVRHRDLYLTTYNTQKGQTSLPGGTRNRNPSKREAADPRFRLHGPLDWPHPDWC